ncbi:ankyrin repeat domain-containing protein [Umezawaea endophytica]|uniref:Ankyrin repeat domain-containing protein n=1 Tax=Umezawaea endophytica TaxID=1654476 RepID=A0A9X2VNL5_9PSEU|nr:ankyrin repeat domain-containing protein [Umezawaea endophytica]MCS7478553.1 ankyrin repeat domain-containing protein [Umezawaea endophytica]
MKFEDAVEAADEATVRSMLAADPGLRDRHGDLVTRMAEARAWPAVRLLVELGFDVNGVTAAGATALHHAAAAGELAITRLLVEHGADHTATEPGFEARPAGWARYFKKPEVREYLESLS